MVFYLPAAERARRESLPRQTLCYFCSYNRNPQDEFRMGLFLNSEDDPFTAAISSLLSS
jgi:hypothetical protein